MGLYWNTLRMAKRNFDSGTMKRKRSRWWTKGIELAAVITTRCNLHCEYCPMFYSDKKGTFDGKYPRYKESSLEEWKGYFERFPFWASQIYITGGEPTLVHWVGDLINWLVDRGHHVILFSNLKYARNLVNIKKSFRFVCYPTYHKSDNYERFNNSLKALRLNTGFRIMIKELEKDNKFDSEYKEYYTDEWFFDGNALLHIAPDLSIHWGCVDAYLGGK